MAYNLLIEILHLPSLPHRVGIQISSGYLKALACELLGIKIPSF